MTPIYGARGLEADGEENIGLGDVRGLGGYDNNACMALRRYEYRADTII